MIADGVTGFITRSLDVDSFTAATERLIDDLSLRQKMREQARQAVADRNWSAAFEQFWGMSE